MSQSEKQRNQHHYFQQLGTLAGTHRFVRGALMFTQARDTVLQKATVARLSEAVQELQFACEQAERDLRNHRKLKGQS